MDRIELPYFKKLRAFCNLELPSVFSEELSYYEVLNRLIQRINEMAEAINALPEEIEEFLKSGVVEEIVRDYIGQFEVNVLMPPGELKPMVPDNKTDNSAIFVALMEYATTHQKRLLVPSGGYYFGFPVTIKDSVFMLGYGASKSVFWTDKKTQLITGESKNIYIKEMGFALDEGVCKVMPDFDVVYMTGKNITFKECLFRGGNVGLDLNDSAEGAGDYIKIIDCDFIDSKVGGLRVVTKAPLTIAGGRIKTDLNATYGAEFNVEKANIALPDIENAKYGIEYRGENTKIEANITEAQVALYLTDNAKSLTADISASNVTTLVNDTGKLITSYVTVLGNSEEAKADAATTSGSEDEESYIYLQNINNAGTASEVLHMRVKNETIKEEFQSEEQGDVEAGVYKAGKYPLVKDTAVPEGWENASALVAKDWNSWKALMTKINSAGEGGGGSLPEGYVDFDSQTGANDNKKFEVAVEACPEGGVILFSCKKYSFTQPIIINKSLSLVCLGECEFEFKITSENMLNEMFKGCVDFVATYSYGVIYGIYFNLVSTTLAISNMIENTNISGGLYQRFIKCRFNKDMSIHDSTAYITTLEVDGMAEAVIENCRFEKGCENGIGVGSNAGDVMNISNTMFLNSSCPEREAANIDVVNPGNYSVVNIKDCKFAGSTSGRYAEANNRYNVGYINWAPSTKNGNITIIGCQFITDSEYKGNTAPVTLTGTSASVINCLFDLPTTNSTPLTAINATCNLAVIGSEFTQKGLTYNIASTKDTIIASCKNANVSVGDAYQKFNGGVTSFVVESARIDTLIKGSINALSCNFGTLDGLNNQCSYINGRAKVLLVGKASANSGTLTLTNQAFTVASYCSGLIFNSTTGEVIGSYSAGKSDFETLNVVINSGHEADNFYMPMEFYLVEKNMIN